jgi:hypothetical protein
VTAVGLVGCVALALGIVATRQGTADAVTLYAKTAATPAELRADATVVRERLSALGYTDAHVAVSGNAIVVTGGPPHLADPKYGLTDSPVLLARPVFCASAPYDGSSSQAVGELPPNCAGTIYEFQPAVVGTTPTGPKSLEIPPKLPDPSLSSYPTTDPAADAASPDASALLPVAGSDGELGTPGEIRNLVGGTQLKLSSRVASAFVQYRPGKVGTYQLPGWYVVVRLGTTGSQEWDAVTQKNFHQELAIDFDGKIVWESFIEYNQASFTPSGGRLALRTGSKSQAESVAASLRSGPLPIPLRVGGTR